jgi:hypothetical protein
MFTLVIRVRVGPSCATPAPTEANRVSAASGVRITEPNGFIELLLLGDCFGKGTLKTDLQQESLRGTQ